jgi:hypothetical protein
MVFGIRAVESEGCSGYCKKGTVRRGVIMEKVPDKMKTCRKLMSYLLTGWSIVLPEKLTDAQQSRNFPTFFGTRRFSTAFTSVHLSLF